MVVMGEMLRLVCKQCGLDREIFHGVGMLGSGETLCTCRHCKRLVMKKWSIHDDPPKGDPFTCPYCKRPIEATLVEDETPDCPTCDRPLIVENIGVWD